MYFGGLPRNCNTEHNECAYSNTRYHIYIRKKSLKTPKV